MTRSRILFAALTIAIALTGVLVLVARNDPKPAQQVSTQSTEPDDGDATLPELDVASDDAATTTTLAVDAPTTTAAVASVAVTTTTAKPAPATTVTTARTATTAKPATTTTAPGPSSNRTGQAVVDSIVNHWSEAIDYSIGSGTSGHWVLQPNQTGGPATIVFGPNNDSSGSHAVSDETCGRGDNDIYFTNGHHYTIEILPNGLQNACGTSGLPGYKVMLHDVTAGTTRQI